MQNHLKKKINNLFGRGFSISKISKEVGVSPGEVSGHIRKIFQPKKRGVKSRKNLVKFPVHKTIQKVKR